MIIFTIMIHIEQHLQLVPNILKMVNLLLAANYTFYMLDLAYKSDPNAAAALKWNYIGILQLTFMRANRHYQTKQLACTTI